MSSSLLTLRFLGGFSVLLDGRPVTRFGTAKTRALLAYLSVEAGHPYTRAALAALFWPEVDERQARHNLSQSLQFLRRALHLASETATAVGSESSFLHLSAQEMSWNPDSAYLLDTARLMELVGSEKEDVPTAALEEAAALYRGEFLAGFSLPDSLAFDEWLLFQRERFQRVALVALGTLTDRQQAAGHFDRAERYARQQLNIDRWHEPAYRQLLMALAAAGRPAEALQQFELCRQTLLDDLGVEPQLATIRLTEAIRQGGGVALVGEYSATTQEQGSGGAEGRRSGEESPNLLISQSLSHNLPQQLTPILGRETERTQLVGWLGDGAVRLVTVVGVGGVGKTCLALAAANELLLADERRFAGVWFISLAGVAAAEKSIVTEVAQALDIAPPRPDEVDERLRDYIHARSLLLVLDNAEHVLDSVRAFAQMFLSASPKLKLLVTSRERLGLAGEQLLYLDGLEVPPDGESVITLQNSSHYPSVRLFAQRAQSVTGERVLSPDNLPAVVTICRLGRGLPLAIELAAAWTEHYTCAEIAAELQTGFDLLESTLADTPDRQRSLRATFLYSWKLLPAAEQALLARLSVFRGQFGREAVLANSGTRLTSLLSLVNKSLVRRVTAGRYELHELLRQFAAKQLLLSGDQADAERRHGRYYLKLLTESEAAFYGAEPQHPLLAIGEELDNVRLAWSWAITRSEMALLNDALPGLMAYHHAAGTVLEATAILEQALDHHDQEVEHGDNRRAVANWPLEHDPLGATLRNRLLAWLAWIRHWQSEYDAAQTLGRAALAAIAVNSDMADSIAESLACLAIGSALRYQQTRNLSARLVTPSVATSETLSGESLLQQSLEIANRALAGSLEQRRLQAIAVEAVVTQAFFDIRLGQHERASGLLNQTWHTARVMGYRLAEGRVGLAYAGVLEAEGAFSQAKPTWRLPCGSIAPLATVSAKVLPPIIWLVC